MALLARFFSPRRNQKKESNVQQPFLNKSSLRSTFTIEREQVRVLLYRECDWRGRKLLFDSSCVQRVPVNNLQINGGQPRRDSKDHVFEINNGFGFKYTKVGRDATSLGETIFGSVALSQRRSSIKVHSLNTPRRLMVSSVIHSPCPRRKRQISDRSMDDSYGSSVNSMSDYFCGNSSDFKSSSWDGQDSLLDHSEGNCDSISYCPIHCTNNLSPNKNSSATSTNSNQSGGSLTSLRRRWLRSVTTSMNLDSLHCLTDIDSSQTTESNSSNDSTQNSQSSASKRTKLGIAIVIVLQESQEKDMEEYLLQRIPLLVHLISRLQQNAEKAYAHKDSFVQFMMEATSDASKDLYDMLCGVSIENPYWLSLTDCHSQFSPDKGSSNKLNQPELMAKLVKDLGYLLQTIDTKHTNFFMSTLLTAVLTHHLGWVSTVVPDDMKNATSKDNHHDVLTALSQSHPYNPLWAQLSDLQGALGFPPKISKTIIIGQSEALVSKVLSVLTYFIRCGKVFCSPEERLQDPNEDCLLEAIVGLKLNSNGSFVLSDKVGAKKNCEREVERIALVHDNTKLFSNLDSSDESSKTGLSKKINCENNFTVQDNFNTQEVCDSDTGCLNKLIGLKRINKSVKLNNYLNLCSSVENLSENDLNPSNISDRVSKLCRVPKSAVLYHMNSSNVEDNLLKEERDKTIIHCKNDDNVSFIESPKRIESEKQMASMDIKNCFNKKFLHSNFDTRSKISYCKNDSYGLLKMDMDKDNKFSSLDEEIVSSKEQEKSFNTNNVVFVLGENEKLVGLRNNHTFQNLVEYNSDSSLKLDTPTVCVKDCDGNIVTKNQTVDLNSNSCSIKYGESRMTDNIVDKTIAKTVDSKIINDNPSNKILIFKPTTIDVQESEKPSLFINPPLRCLSIPDEVMFSTDEVKGRRSRETVEIIRRWLSDSEIYNTYNKNCSNLVDNVLSSTTNEIIGSSEILSNIENDDLRTNLENSPKTVLESVSECCVDSEQLDSRTSALVNVNGRTGRDYVEKSESDDCKNPGNRVKSEDVPNQCAIMSEDIHLPLPNSRNDDSETEINLPSTLLGGVSNHYIPSLVLQGIVEDGSITTSRPLWESELRRDLHIEAHSPVLNQEISEAVCIVANLNTWEVQLVSSHTLVVEKILEGKRMGVTVGMSQLVANMLETVLSLSKLPVQPKHCITHIEAKLNEFWLRSIALSELLLGEEFLDMETLTSALDLDPNDVPLLLSVASIHSPQVTKKYGLSFQ